MPWKPFGPCTRTYRLDFSALRTPGRYRVTATGPDVRVASRTLRIGDDVYDAAADTLLAYMRQQRSGFNPFFRDSVHRLDGIIVDDPSRENRFIDVSGGWADAGDYLQYVATSSYATFAMMMAYRDNPSAYGDGHDARGLPGANGVPDVLDEARHGLDWLLRMFPSDDQMYNQLGDDRDHSFLDLPTTDSSDYGWGKGGYRPVYPCTGRPQGLLRHRNRSDGMASTAGKMASAFALGARLFAERDPELAAVLERKARAAYALGIANPGVCQTAPARAPYFYEEENWADDMELAAAALGALTGRAEYLDDALRFARMEPVTPWMGADTANHYQWFPWHNNGHYEISVARGATPAMRREVAGFYRRGLAAVARRADNGFGGYEVRNPEREQFWFRRRLATGFPVRETGANLCLHLVQVEIADGDGREIERLGDNPLAGKCGVSVDQQFRTEYLTRLTDTAALRDMTYYGLPPFYPPGWFWLGGRLAAGFKARVEQAPVPAAAGGGARDREAPAVPLHAVADAGRVGAQALELHEDRLGDHSGYRGDPWGRLARTSTFLATTTFGTADYLAPEQAVIVTVSEKQAEYAQEVVAFLRSKRLRVRFANRRVVFRAGRGAFGSVSSGVNERPISARTPSASNRLAARTPGTCAIRVLCRKTWSL